MPERTVKQTLASYRRADGSMGYALAGETVDVAADDIKRFDEANGGAPEGSTPAKKAAPKARK